MKKMEYQDIINGLAITAISCLIWAMFCLIGIGIATHKRDKAFEKSKIEYKEKMKQYNDRMDN